jgi:hypothetical protein
MFGVVLGVTVALSATPPVGYEAAVAKVPPRHWALVRSASVDRTSNGQAHRADMSIHLAPATSKAKADQVLHEVGHVVFYADRELDRDYCARFWPRGKLRGVPPSPYAARTGCAEDEADGYKQMLTGGSVEDPARTRFFRERVFRPGELP